MHSFHHSRGRILFEVACALVVFASCAGAWMQTGAWALLPTGLVALLYGVIHLFDMAGRRDAASIEPQRIDFATNDLGGRSAKLDDVVLPRIVEQHLKSESISEEAKPVEPVAPAPSKGSRAKSPRKARARASVSEERKTSKAAGRAETDVPEDPPYEEMAHHSLAPLFAPEPFARQRHATFGRKAG